MDAPRYELAVTVKNDSLRAGKEVVQVYVAPKERQDDRPAHKLCAFEKMELMPGEEKTVTLLLPQRRHFPCMTRSSMHLQKKWAAMRLKPEARQEISGCAGNGSTSYHTRAGDRHDTGGADNKKVLA